jgi:PilZ domain
MPSDKRRQERFSLDLQAKITYRHLAEQQPLIDTVAANISAGGAFLKTTQPFPLAAKVRVEFLLDLEDLKRLKFILSLDSLKNLENNKVWVAATAIVIRCQADGIGIIFDTDYQATSLPPATTKED